MGRIARIIDLSHRVAPGITVFPGDPEVEFEAAASLATDGVNVTRLHLGSHSGTHVDAPSHFIEGAAGIDEIDPKVFVGPAVLVDLRKKGEREPVTPEDLAPYVGRLGAGVIAVLHTGWDRFWGTSRYLDHPYLSPDAARTLVASGVRAVATDALNVDETRPDGDGEYPAHREILGAGGVIAENLTNLAGVDFPDPLVSLLPVKLAATDGAPARAVALELI
ncbi:putative metal-dependent hydrolase [Rubrobacter radiotolerans]|uniref:Cyclase family protein n=1 Tax=Rubrobacter radiotolerans TaxID=42256 RepID=A0A023X0Q0_RUBRA|nr:cyclase family protein [Rubrobacter radiotolerans]AHY45629.1 putative metal-dependent hydrolase [Rubrobacter radiotolerans]MDX5893043.1 cyclase family protein [Rubrobacter radiotolerans]SMC02947.1 Kynurenine formamidase [Rubrobacter radiotolerans DSM 5868]